MVAWKTDKLSEVCEIQRGGSPRPIENFITDAEDGINWIKIGDVAKGAKYITSTREKIRHEGAHRSRTVCEGDFLLSNSMSFGRPYILRTSGCIHDGWLVLRYDKNQLTEDYLYHVLSSDFVYAQFVKFAVGAVVKNLNSEVVKSVTIPLPPLSEQIRIAAILDQADGLRVKRREALAQLDSLTQSIFMGMFGNPATNPKGWQSCKFGSIGDNQDAQRIPVKSSDRDGRKGEYPYYGASGIIDWVDEYIYDGERLLIGEDGANLIARSTPIAYMATGKFWVNNHAHVIASNGRANLRFLEFYIEQLDLKPYISGSAQPKLNRSNLDRIPVYLPPLELQDTFAERISAVEKLKILSQKGLSEFDSLFTSLQHRAFRGEL